MKRFISSNFKAYRYRFRPLLISKALFFSLGIASCCSFPFLAFSRELPQERELYQTLPQSNDNGSILDVTNPLDLMNRLRRATAMDDATSPSDAIDEALKDFEVNDSVQP